MSETKKVTKKVTKKKPTTKKKATTKKKPAPKKKIDQKIIQKVVQDVTKTRDYQRQYDDRYNCIVWKFNMFQCPHCKMDISVASVTLFTDVETGKKYLGLRKTCSTSCSHNDAVFELNEVSEEQIKKDGLNTFNQYG